MFCVQYDLGSSLPTCNNLLGLLLVECDFVSPAQAEVTYFEVAPLVEQNIRGLEVPVDDVAAVQEQHAAQDLLGKLLDMVVTQGLFGLDNPVQVSLH